MDNAFFDYISSSALSLVVSGNTGISPFLTLFVLGVTEMSNPELLNMGQTMEVALASWWSIGILGLLTLGETIGKCIPAIDELIDSAEVFVVPVISVLASLATMGLLPSSGSNDDAGKGQPLDVMGLLGGSGGDADSEFYDGGDGDYRLLQGDYNTTVIDIDDDGTNGFGEGFITFTKVILVIVGIGLSLLIHFFKMLVRVSSMVCSGGCCQPCLTVAEFLIVIFGVLLAIVAPIFAIVACGALLIAAGYVIYVRCCKKDVNDENDDNKNTTNSNNNNKKRNSNGNNSGRGGDDIENQKKGSSKPNKRNTSITVAELPPPSEPIYAHAEVISTLPPSPSAPPAANNPKNNNNKPDIEATTY